MNKKVMLMILDGWGIGKKDKSDVIYNANTPNMDKLTAQFANAQLQASGQNVGLPDGQMGNSEVGHLNIGAGRIVYQDLVKINQAVKDRSIEQNEEIVKAWQYAKENNKAVHLVGLVSDGGVHSSNKHLYKLAKMADAAGIDNINIHALTDGRDTDPKSGKGFIQELQNEVEGTNAKIASIVGRYYGMDRDKRWERIKLAYDLYVHGKGKSFKDPVQAMQASYDDGVTDEFIKPVVITNENDEPTGTINEGDVVFCFNFRTDRLRELTIVLTQQDMPEHDMKTMPLYYLTMTRYDDSFKDVHIPFDKENLKDTMGEVLAREGKKQIRIAETEKYAHVTFFFSGGQEKEFENEKRILIPSPKVATYDMQPEMSAYKVKDAIVEELHKAETDFVCLNFANGDMVGHTGVYEAIEKAVEAVDECVGDVVEAARQNDYELVIIADHGNADNAVNPDESPNTAHSLNAVPIIVVSDRYKKVNNGILADVAPTILEMMGLQRPEAMTGKPLVE
ncbi:2,3-bisphosphoglycerate-independent phosphoglycerate mutase [Salinivirga cyanobacteriivorans]|uniref:2,3-bisphosphoglycerate-independent phosphoglycerate mutase n=1 Tax=Salinivirga cyanobacteriivorans TaxID=1307839 RepID=A0A0S2HZJ2_9BACT|nr:2,3-bisphosphoglycerate-independent phosphoglycerate mutase [Salinivirga cyanobacteriivorans]ALO15435.1 2,3-bisphosphoglycerate-independent phosphoglycerate mutase [Salinivirga cyanobacteriivorans]